MGGKCEFAAGANMMGACFGSGPIPGSGNAVLICAAAVRSERIADAATMSHFEQLDRDKMSATAE